MTLFLVTLVFIGLAVALAWFLLSRDRGEREPVMVLWLAAGLGLLGAVTAAWLENTFLDETSLLPGLPHQTLLISALTIGVIEEICKFGPLALLLSSRRYFNEHTDGIIYFSLAGLGFGLPENILYTFQFGAKTGLTRLFLTPLFHAATTGIIGYFLIKRKLAGKSLWGVVGPLSVVIILHALYDFGLASGSAIFGGMALTITLATSAGLFVLFLKAIQNDQRLGLSAVGHNNFCRSCGRVNPEHHLYCTHCGKNA